MFDEKVMALRVHEIPVYVGYPAEIPLDNPQVLAALPILTKAQLNGQFPMIWMTPGLRAAIAADEVEYASTSGTSGDRLQIVRDRNWWHLEYRRTYAVHPLLAMMDPAQTQKAVLTTSVCSSAVCWRDNPTYDQRIIGRTLHLNTAPDPNRWSAADVAQIVAEIDRWQPDYLDMHGGYGSILARKATAFGIAAPRHRPRVITVSYDFASSAARRQVEAFFGTRTHDLFGATEFGYAFVETDDGFRPVVDSSAIELLPVAGRLDVKRLVITTSKNRHMPLVRYETGDLLIVDPDAPDRPIATAGRMKDCARDAAGGLVTPRDVDRALEATGAAPVQFQMRWNATAVELLVVADAATDTSAWERAMRGLMGVACAASVRCVTEIAPEGSGKFAAIKHV
jgi:phenylacetate-CoA ligase